MGVAMIGGNEVPYVYAVTINRETIGDEARTAGGKLRRDVVAIKHSWRLQTRPMTAAEAATLTDYIEGLLGGTTTFVLKGTSYTAFVDIENEEFVQFGRDGVWHNDGRQLTLTIREQ